MEMRRKHFKTIGYGLTVIFLFLIINSTLNIIPKWEDVPKNVVKFSYSDTTSMTENTYRTKNIIEKIPMKDLCILYLINGGLPPSFRSAYEANKLKMEIKKQVFDNYNSSNIEAISILFAGMFLTLFITAFKEWPLGSFGFRSRVKHIRNEHKWIIDYGLSKVHEKNNMPRQHYYDALDLVTRGYSALLESDPKTKNNKIDVYLFYPETISGLKYLLENDPDGRLNKLFLQWNGLGERYKIRRFFICNKNEYDTDQNFAWYQNEYKNVEPFNLNNADPDVTGIVKELDKDLDFAIFEGANNKLCVGFIDGYITYIMVGADTFGYREKLCHLAISFK